MGDRLEADQGNLAELQRQLEFWRERHQVASNSCRSGALRDRAAHEIQSLERMIDDLRRSPGSE